MNVRDYLDSFMNRNRFTMLDNSEVDRLTKELSDDIHRLYPGEYTIRVLVEESNIRLDLKWTGTDESQLMWRMKYM